MSSYSIHQQNPLPPYQLKLTQEWFADVITKQLGENNTIQSHTNNGMTIAEEAARYITPSRSLQPHQRMQIYNQQYWWRLLNILHANFPLVTRLFGYHSFNEKIGIPYLSKYPPNHWSLNVLGERLPIWIQEFYQAPDQSFILDTVKLDEAFMKSFIAPQHPSPNLSELVQENPEGLLSQIFYLQPSIHLFSWSYDLLTFRRDFLMQKVEYWMEHRFPDLSKGQSFFFILYRNTHHQIAWRSISKGEFLLLERFKEGTNMIDACAYIESQEASLYEEIVNHLQKWLTEWIQARWLTLNIRKGNYFTD